MSGLEHFPPNAIRLAASVWAAPGAIRFTFSRSSGPGGQAVNKLSTRAQLRIAVADINGLSPDAAGRLRSMAGRRLTQDDEIALEAETYRSQLDNKQACIEKLAALVQAAQVRPKVRRKRKPTRAMIRKRLELKRRTSQKKRLRRGGAGDES
jgi:ribosome-associated protein